MSLKRLSSLQTPPAARFASLLLQPRPAAAFRIPLPLRRIFSWREYAFSRPRLANSRFLAPESERARGSSRRGVKSRGEGVKEQPGIVPERVDLA